MELENGCGMTDEEIKASYEQGQESYKLWVKEQGKIPIKKSFVMDELYFKQMCLMGFKFDKMERKLGLGDGQLEQWTKKNYGKDVKTFCERIIWDEQMKIRDKQIEVAMRGNVLMLIWLGRNMLGQSEEPIREKEVREDIVYRRLEAPTSDLNTNDNPK